MPKLSISTIVELVAAARNNSERAVICMAITDRDGKGVSGLTESNFTIDDLLVAPGGSGVHANRRAIRDRSAQGLGPVR